MITDTQRYKTSRANWEIADPGASGAISVRQSGYVPLVTAAAESRTVDDPHKPGLDLTLQMKTDGGDCTVTFDTAFTEAGDTTIVFSDAGQFARFYSIESGTSYVWRRYAADPTEAATITTLTTTLVSATTVNTMTLGVTNINLTGEIRPTQAVFASGGVAVQSVEADTGQATDITTAVPILNFAGTFNTQASTLAAAAEQSFDVTNAGISVLDIPVIAAKYNGTGGTPCVYVSDVAAGSFTITVANLHASAALDGDFDINYFIIKQLTA